VYFAENVAYFHFNSWLSFQRLCRLLWGFSNKPEHTHTHPFNGPFSGTTRVSRYQKGKTNLDFTEARDSEWQWHQLSHMQVCTSLHTDNHASNPPLSFLQTGCPSCRPTNSVKALKALGNKPENKLKINVHSTHQHSQTNSTFTLKLNLQPQIHLYLTPSPSDRLQLLPGFI